MSDELLAEFGFEPKQKTSKIPTWGEFIGDEKANPRTPEEYNAAREFYKNKYADKYALQQGGKEPHRDKDAWHERLQAEKESFYAAVDQYAPPRKVDQWTDVANNYGHAAATGVAKGMRLVTDIAGEDNPASQHLTRIIDFHQSGMTFTEQLLKERAQTEVEQAHARGDGPSIWDNITTMRMTGAIETLILPLLLLSFVVFRKRHQLTWPRLKMPVFSRPAWPRRQKMIWSSISPDEAKIHPLYGIKYGLILLAVSQLLQPLSVLGHLNTALHDAKITHAFFFVNSPSAPLYTAVLLISLISTVMICGAMFTKHPRFRSITTWVFLMSFPAVLFAAMIFRAPNSGEVIAQSLLAWLISCSIWVTYVQRSTRVRVTFEHQVKTVLIPKEVLPDPLPPNTTEYPPAASANLVLSVDKPAGAPHLNAAETVKVANATLQVSSLSDEEAMWAHALREFESDKRKPGLWAKCYALHKGQEAASKAAYLTERVDQLRATGDGASVHGAIGLESVDVPSHRHTEKHDRLG